MKGMHSLQRVGVPLLRVDRRFTTLDTMHCFGQDKSSSAALPITFCAAGILFKRLTTRSAAICSSPDWSTKPTHALIATESLGFSGVRTGVVGDDPL